MKKKIYVLDTNILVQSPDAFFRFEDNVVVLPMVLIEELDSLKSFDGDRGRSAREAIRRLEQLRGQGDLLVGVSTPDGGMIRVEKNFVDVKLPEDLPDNKSDNRILKVCLGLKAANTDCQVILITKDILLRIKAQLLELKAQDFMAEQVAPESQQYTGRRVLYAEEDAFEDFKKKGIAVGKVYMVDANGTRLEAALELNEFVILMADRSNRKTQLGRFDGKKIVPLEYRKAQPFGVKPRNVGQYFLQEALMASPKDVPLVIVKGMAGTAKTFYALAVGLEKVYNSEQRVYSKILVTRPNVQFDNDIGFLPGSEQEKISPLMRPIIDNLEQLIDSDEDERYSDEQELHGKIEELFDRQIIVGEAMSFIRGRSFAQTYLIIDEAQNMTPKQVKGIITRAGKGTKVILLGDPKQIDNPYLDEKTNGLSYASERMKGSSLCYQITLSADECERSVLAMDAINRL